MILNIRNFINLLILAIMISTLPAMEGNAHKGGHNHKGDKQTGIEPGGTYQLAVINPAPDFTLVDLKGEKASLKDLNGKIKIVNFIYTFCPDVCPIITGKLLKMQNILRKEGLLGKKVEIISISLDPERDTAEQLKKYANGFKADGNGWLFLRGTEGQTKKVLKDYDIWSKKLDDGTIDHVMRVYLIDAEDMIREIYNLAFLQPELALRDIEMILIEK